MAMICVCVFCGLCVLCMRRRTIVLFDEKGKLRSREREIAIVGLWWFVFRKMENFFCCIGAADSVERAREREKENQ